MSISSPARVRTPSSPKCLGSSNRSTPSSHSGKTAFDWPLSREEKKACIMRFYDNEITASQAMLKSTPAAVQSVRDEVNRVILQCRMENGAESVQATSSDTESTPVKRLLMTPEKQEAIDDGEEAASEISAVDSIMNNLSRLSDTSVASTKDSEAAGGSAHVDPEILQETLTALSKLLAASQVAKIATKEEQDELYGASPTNRTSKSVPERSCAGPPSALRRKHRRSRGPDERVRFAVEEGSDEEKPGDAIDEEKQARERGRAMRRVSRGPDGKTYSVPECKQDISSSGKVATVAASAVAGGSGGFLAGGTVGAVLGVPAVLFTFGLSIPIGAALGSGAGLAAGSALGGSAGFLFANRQEAASYDDA